MTDLERAVPRRAGKFAPVPAEIRFWAKVERTATCWLWKASGNPCGYGQIYVNGKLVLAHRFSWALHRGPIPVGLVIDHLCRTPACVNPDHLEPVTQEENRRRGNWSPVLNSKKELCKRGHALTARDGRGDRECRTCKTMLNLRRYR